MNTGIAAIISSLVGYGLFAYKNKAGKDTDLSIKTDKESEQAQTDTTTEQTNDKRGGSMYFGKNEYNGDPLDGGVYDPFYDYSADGGEKLYFRREFIDNVVTNEERVKTLRARIIAPFVTSELAGEDESFIGTKAKDRNGYSNGLWLYRNGRERVQVNDGTIFARSLAKGNVRNVSFFLEIFNPCKKDVTVETIGVDNIFVGSSRCQMVHLASNNNISSRPTDTPSDVRVWRSSVYRNSFDIGLENKFNEGKTEIEITRDKYHKIIHTGNQPYFAARELQIEALNTNATQKAVWKQCEYPYDMLDGNLSIVSKKDTQNPMNIFDGLEKYGINQNVFDYESSKYNYNPKFCVVPALGSVIVKMVMPLADMETSTVNFVAGTDIYRLHTKGSDAGTFDELRTSNHYYYSLFPYEQYITSDQYQKYNQGDEKSISENYEFNAREYFFKHDFNEGVRGYCVFDIKPAPELSNKNLSMKLTLYGRRSDLRPKNDPILTGGSNSNGNAIEVKMIATPVDPNDMDWRNSYYGSGPDERLSANEQINLYLAKTGSEIGEYFDPTVNN